MKKYEYDTVTASRFFSGLGRAGITGYLKLVNGVATE